jgi:hypothetical protein
MGEPFADDLQQRAQHLAGSAPRGPELYQNREAMAALDDINIKILDFGYHAMIFI